MKITAGDKFYKKYSKDNSEDIRIIRIKNPHTFSCITNSGKKCVLSDEDIKHEYTHLIPDGYMTFSIVYTSKKNKTKDVIISFYKTKDLENDIKFPCIICRQDVEDLFAKQTNNNPFVAYMGLSISDHTAPAGVDIKPMLACDKIIFTFTVSTYIDDTLDTILSFFNHSKFDAVLSNMKTKVESLTKDRGIDFLGYQKSLKDLVEYTDMKLDFHMAFDIIDIPFQMLQEDGEELTSDQLKYLQYQTRKMMYKTYVIKYYKDIDLDKIVRKYRLVCDSKNELYIVAYDEGDEYINSQMTELRNRSDVKALLANMYNSTK